MSLRVKSDFSAVERVSKAFASSALLAAQALQRPLNVLGVQLAGSIRSFTPVNEGQLRGSLTKRPIINTSVQQNKMTITFETGFNAKHATKMEKGHGPGQAGSWNAQRKGLERWVNRNLKIKNKKGNPRQTRIAFMIWQKHMNEGFSVPITSQGKNKGKGAMLQQAQKKFGPRLQASINQMTKAVTEAIIKRASKNG